MADLLRKIVALSQQHLVIVRTSWIKELAEAEGDFVAGARALDRVFLRFGTVSLVSPDTFQKAVLKMGSLQSPRRDIILWTGPESIKQALAQVQTQVSSQSSSALRDDLINLSGSPTAKAVLVGEKINPYLEFHHWPFFDDRDSAKFISDALEKANILESDLMWTNAVHTNQSLVIQSLLVQKPALKVVALGEVAHQKLTELGISHRRVSHPQYARRFDTHGNYDIILDQAIRS